MAQYKLRQIQVRPFRLVSGTLFGYNFMDFRSKVAVDVNVLLPAHMYGTSHLSGDDGYYAFDLYAAYRPAGGHWTLSTVFYNLHWLYSELAMLTAACEQFPHVRYHFTEKIAVVENSIRLTLIAMHNKAYKLL